MTSSRPSLDYRPDIEGLRAIAVLLVVVFHFHLFSESKSGFVGVDVFFVISGYLITSIIRRDVDAGHFSLRQFWTRRVRRLAPALFVVLAGMVGYGWLRLLPLDFKELLHQLLAAQFYYANVYYWQNINYFGLKSNDIYLLHTWSLSLEEQFYILYPVVLAALLKHARRWAFTAILIAAVISFALNLWFVDSKPEATFYLMPTRAWELLVGALLTWAPPIRRAIASNALACVGIGLIGAAVVGHHEGVSFPGTFALLPVMGAASLLHAGSRESLAVRSLGIAPLTYIGRLSYSLYLVHWPVNVVAATELGDDYTAGWRLAMVVLCLLLSALLYHFVENPARRVKMRSSAFLMTYASGLMASIAVCVAIILGQGFPWRLPQEVTALAAYSEDKVALDCEFTLTSSPCVLGARDKEPEWLVYGDSHAWAAQAAFDKWLQGDNKSALFTFLNSCPPVVGVHLFRHRPLCAEMNQRMLLLAAKNPNVKNVFLVSTWRQAMGALTTSPNVKLSFEASVELFNRQFAATVRELSAQGKNVYIWEPLPGAKQDVPRALALAAWRGRPVDIEFSRNEYFHDHSYFFSALDASRERIHATFSTSSVLCGTGKCTSVLDKTPLYFDNGHLARATSSFWAEALRLQLSGPGASIRRAGPRADSDRSIHHQ